jgi:hypothetical protein
MQCGESCDNTGRRLLIVCKLGTKDRTLMLPIDANMEVHFYNL